MSPRFISNVALAVAGAVVVVASQTLPELLSAIGAGGATSPAHLLRGAKLR
jgi:hypothetical protein